ncbi:MAG TPA: peptide MFS transporter [Saprospiraceae bacterium]|jgi:POT family proton-dependent oligopeptide transporter|nr:peptide MFS transporter [Saprospiraceae bacterium]HRO08329.1 peptide MFS transporter [Saprospiraceae bacterium]HRP41722.1 peptide MFS transporter [Saprospiraceae bacterium]
MSTANAQGHPRGLYLLFFTEMWERFSYYGMRAIFILFMTKALLIATDQASIIYGSYTGLVYLTPLLGGYLADRYWGNRKSIFLGGIIMAIGQFLMFLSSSFYQEQGFAITMMWGGLTFLIVGNGFFKPNISTMVGQLYTKEDRRVDSAFTIFYMGINLGAFFSPLICGGLGDTGNPADFKWGFLAACIGMIISVISFELLKNKHLNGPDNQAIGTQVKKTDFKVLGLVIGAIALIFFLMNFKSIFNTDFDIVFYLIVFSFIASPLVILTDKSITSIERDRIFVIFILAFFVIFFWSAFEQAGASLTLFAEDNVDRNAPFTINKYIIFLVISLIVFYLMKFLEWFFEWKENTYIKVSGVIVTILLVLLFMGKIESFSKDVIPSSWFQSVNPLVIVTFAPIMSWLWTKLGDKQPSSPTKMAIGLLLVSVGYMVIAFGVKGVDSTIKVSMIWLLSLYFIHTIGELCLSPIGLSMVSKLSPLRFSSLLMGTWFLANALANKFAGTLSSLLPPSAGADVTAQAKSILGFQINSLYDFFFVFIVMAGFAALVLFVLSRKLQKMMHGIN